MAYTYGLTMIGLDTASDDTDVGYGCGARNEIYYNVDTGDVWCKYLIGNNYLVDDNNPSVIYCGYVEWFETPQGIADIVFDAYYYND